MVHNALEIKKQTNTINESANSPMTGFETAPLQKRKQEGDTIGVLLYCFYKHGVSRLKKLRCQNNRCFPHNTSVCFPPQN